MFGLCAAHAKQRQRGSALAPLRSPMTPPKICKIDGCGKKSRGRGLCRNHYARTYRREKAMTAKKQSDEPKCAAPGCDRWTHDGVHCWTHSKERAEWLAEQVELKRRASRPQESRAE